MAALPAFDILVVDDEPDLRTLYELTLLREGYRVEAAQDLREARAALAERRFHAIITDMRLPDGLGIELLRELSQSQRSERAIVITAHGSAENAVEALKCGAFDYLTKPVDLKQFRAVVAAALHSLAAPDPARPQATLGAAKPGQACRGLTPANQKVSHAVANSRRPPTNRSSSLSNAELDRMCRPNPRRPWRDSGRI